MTNMILGLVLLYTNGALTDAHVVGSYASYDECRSQVAAIVKANMPEPPKGVEVYVMCLDTTRGKSEADKQSAPKPPTTSL